MERLSLHQLATNGAPPERLVELAARLECPAVTPFVNASARSNSPHVATLAQARDLRRLADGLGVDVYSLEVFVLEADTDPAAFRPALERGATLGGRRTTVCVGDPDLGRARDRFDAFCAMAADFGIAVHVEFHAFGTLRTLAATQDFLCRAPTAATISVDVLHLYRNEGGIGSLRGPLRVPIGHAQICDGPLVRPRDEWLHEAVADRLVPGEGAFNLVAFLRALPPAVRIDVEVPTRPDPAGELSGEARCAAALQASRRLLARARAAAEPR
ncbi:MAG: sugar phosphate isomerase/epimerase family protein [Gemmobacter sp.]